MNTPYIMTQCKGDYSLMVDTGLQTYFTVSPTSRALVHHLRSSAIQSRPNLHHHYIYARSPRALHTYRSTYSPGGCVPRAALPTVPSICTTNVSSPDLLRYPNGAFPAIYPRETGQPLHRPQFGLDSGIMRTECVIELSARGIVMT